MMLNQETYKWYAIYTKANGEKKLFESLQEKNIECYLPLRKTLRAWSDRKKWIDEPLFRSYLFVKVSNKEFFDVLNTVGVVCYVSFSGKAQSIPESQIANIKNFLLKCDREVTLTYERIQKGVSVEIKGGALKGIIGEVVSLNGQSRLLLRIETLNCCLYANISKDEVTIIDEKFLEKNPKEFYR